MNISKFKKNLLYFFSCFFLLSFLNILNANEKERVRGNIKYTCITDGKIKVYTNNRDGYITLDSSYCYNTYEASLFYNGKCLKDKKCLSEKKYKLTMDKKDKSPTIGSFDYRTCWAAKGRAEIIEFLDPSDNTYQKTARCVFSDDSFVDTGILIEESEINFTQKK